MVIGLLTLELNIPAHSLKGKRHVVKSVKTRMRNEFNVGVAEVDALDSHQTAVIAAVCVSNDNKYVYGLLNRVVNWVEETRLDCLLVDYQIEML